MENVKRPEEQKEFIEFVMEPANDEGKRAYMCMEKKQYDRVMPPVIDWGVRVVSGDNRDERCWENGHVWDLNEWEPVEEDWKYLDAGKCLVCGAVGHMGISSAEVARIQDLRLAAKAQEA